MRLLCFDSFWPFQVLELCGDHGEVALWGSAVWNGSHIVYHGTENLLPLSRGAAIFLNRSWPPTQKDLARRQECKRMKRSRDRNV